MKKRELKAIQVKT